MNANLRKYTRVPIHMTTELRMSNGRMHKCISNNISFGGALIDLPQGVKVDSDDTCEVALVLQEKPERIEIKFKCKMIHMEDNQVGLQFVGVYAEHYRDFVYMMVNEVEDPDILLEEMSKNPGYEISTIK
ncbi:MAG: PilZ domain-containing protein [Gammaproteobacteria bacterium]|nr:PilZ domain-containing protein [Gammaproteobacteria bacterium]